jgi:hypothetical protein
VVWPDALFGLRSLCVGGRAKFGMMPTMHRKLDRHVVTIITNQLKPHADYVSLLTGYPCSLVQINLRKLRLLPGFWIGHWVRIVLPLEKAPLLAPWQYLRFARPFVVFVTLISLLGAMSSLNLEPRSVAAYTALALFPLLTIGMWMFITYLLNRFEFVRLIRYDKAVGTVTVRFSTEALADNARTQLPTSN